MMQATAAERRQWKSRGYDGLPPPGAAAFMSWRHSQQQRDQTSDRSTQGHSIVKVTSGRSKQSGGVGLLRASPKARFRDDCT